MTDLNLPQDADLPGVPSQVLSMPSEISVRRSPPNDPLSAAVHTDPYLFYAGLVTREPMRYDSGLGLWIAAGAAAVREVLTSQACRVRPLAEPVPAALEGTPAGDIFARLVRMNDGPAHCPLKQAVVRTLQPVDCRRLFSAAESWTRHLLESSFCGVSGGDTSGAPGPDITFRLPIYAVGSLLGIPSDLLPHTLLWMDDFVRCLAPGSDPGQIERGSGAAESLSDLFRDLFRSVSRDRLWERPPGQGILRELLRTSADRGLDDPNLIIANAIGFLSQSYEATAGLIGNTLVALARDPVLADAVAATPELLEAVIREVSRFDPPIQNTRRFLAEDTIIAGRKLKAGDAILLVLAAANRDPAVNPDPNSFDPRRCDPVVFSFSAGAHQCPGAEMASAISRGAVKQLLAAGVRLEELAGNLRYRPSQNARVPLLNWQKAL
jgi:cytochrome P450